MAGGASTGSPWWCDAVGARVVLLVVAAGVALIGPAGARAWPALLVVAGWVAVTGVVAWRAGVGASPRHGVRPRVALVDVLLLVAGVATTGGAESPLRWLLLAVPALWSVGPLRSFVGLVAVAGGGYVAVAVPDLDDGDARAAAARFVVLYGGGAVLARIGGETHARAERERLALVRARAEHAEELARRERHHFEQLTGRLHDGPLQDVSSVLQDLEEHRTGERVDFDRVSDVLRRSLTSMRDMTRDRYATVLDDAGLAAALGHAATEARLQGGPPVTVEVGVASSGDHDGLLVAATHELLTNVRKHARATRASVVVSRGPDGAIVLEVRDDGVGMSQDARRAATDGGHIGLDATARRVVDAGGTVHYDDDDAGTTVVVHLPAAA